MFFFKTCFPELTYEMYEALGGGGGVRAYCSSKLFITENYYFENMTFGSIPAGRDHRKTLDKKKPRPKAELISVLSQLNYWLCRNSRMQHCFTAVAHNLHMGDCVMLRSMHEKLIGSPHHNSKRSNLKYKVFSKYIETQNTKYFFLLFFFGSKYEYKYIFCISSSYLKYIYFKYYPSLFVM